MRGSRSRGLTSLAGREVVIDADTAQIPVGVDGEALVLDTPVRCGVQPAALRVRVPRDRPGVPDVKPPDQLEAPAAAGPDRARQGRRSPTEWLNPAQGIDDGGAAA